MNKKKGIDQGNSTVLIFPAQTPSLEDNQIFFLFSIRQMITVLNHPRTVSEPESLCGLCGRIEFEGKELPILSLESCLGLPLSESTTAHRFIVIREVYENETGKLQHVLALCKLNAAVRSLQLPLECLPVAVPSTIRNASFVKGAYQMEKSIFLIVDLRQIMEALTLLEKETAYGNQGSRIKNGFKNF